MDVTILLRVMQLAGDRLKKSDEMDVTKGSDGKQGNVPAKRNVPLFHEYGAKRNTNVRFTLLSRK